MKVSSSGAPSRNGVISAVIAPWNIGWVMDSGSIEFALSG